MNKTDKQRVEDESVTIGLFKHQNIAELQRTVGVLTMKYYELREKHINMVKSFRSTKALRKEIEQELYVMRLVRDSLQDDLSDALKMLGVAGKTQNYAFERKIQVEEIHKHSRVCGKMECKEHGNRPVFESFEEFFKRIQEKENE